MEMVFIQCNSSLIAWEYLPNKQNALFYVLKYHSGKGSCGALVQNQLFLWFQIPVGLIYAKSTHIVWPPHRWKMLASTPEKHRIIGEDDSIAADADSELIEEILEMNVDISDTRVAKVKPVTWRPEIHGRR